MSTPWILNWCPRDSGGTTVTDSDNSCNHCIPGLPPDPTGGGPGYGLPPFQAAVVNITQEQYAWGPSQIGPFGPNAVDGRDYVTQIYGQSRIESANGVKTLEEIHFGTFVTWNPPNQSYNTFISVLTITHPWNGGSFPLPAISGNGDLSQQNAAEQATIAQAYAALGIT